MLNIIDTFKLGLMIQCIFRLKYFKLIKKYLLVGCFFPHLIPNAYVESSSLEYIVNGRVLHVAYS